MKRPAKTMVLLALFAVLTLVAIMAVYALHQTPTQGIVLNTLCTYSSRATYDYTAMLEPNTIYQNKTTLKPNEGPIYTRITKQMILTLAYTFQASLTAEATIAYSIAENLETGALSYEIVSTSQTTTNQTQFEISLPPVDKNVLDGIKATIESETGASSSTYSLQIAPTFTVDANTTAGPIHQVFTPTLIIDFQHTDQGDIITVGDLQQTQLGSITETQTTTRQDIINQQYASYVLVALSLTGLGVSARFYTRTGPTEKKPQFEKLVATHKDLIIETQEPLNLPEQATMINVENTEELIRIAEILAKPIVLTRTTGQTVTLTIIDQNTVYQFQTTAFKRTPQGDHSQSTYVR
jgi:hypothetical protein